jgi:hypothetical protein
MTARPWLLTPSPPAPHAGGPGSGSMTRLGEPVRGYCVPASGLLMDVGWSTRPGGGGGTASHVKTCGPSLQCLLAPASQPRALVQPNDRVMTFLCGPLSLCASGLSGVRLPDGPRSFPPHGLRTRRDRGDRASAPHQERSEFHRHRAQVLRSGRRVAPDLGPIPPIAPPIWLLANASHLDTTVDGLDVHTPASHAAIGSFVRAREGPAPRLLRRQDHRDLRARKRQDAQILEPLTARRPGLGCRLRHPLIVGTARRGVTQTQARQPGIDQPHVFHRVARFLAAITARLLSRILGTLDTPFGAIVPHRGEAGATGLNLRVTPHDGL